jgi:hypothetical protein
MLPCVLYAYFYRPVAVVFVGDAYLRGYSMSAKVTAQELQAILDKKVKE